MTVDTTDLKILEKEIERVVSSYLRPSFLSTRIIEKYNQIHITLCHPLYTFYDLEKRINIFYEVVGMHSNVLNKCSVVVECYSDNEMDDVLKNIHLLGDQ